jgi:hypothetical protein
MVRQLFVDCHARQEKQHRLENPLRASGSAQLLKFLLLPK